jgi:Uncharacterised nucleotidyltransferase
VPLLRAVVEGDTRCAFDIIEPLNVDAVVEAGFGPALAWVTRDRNRTRSTRGISNAADDPAVALHAADLTARVITGELLDALSDLVAASRAAGCAPVLLKGCAAAIQFYPAPHLRTMGDIDLLVAPGEYPTIAALLRDLGFEAKRQHPEMAIDYRTHHHHMPFWHAGQRLWVEVHTRLFPAHSPLCAAGQFALDAIEPLLVTRHIGQQPVRVMTPEMHLLYTSARWAESLNRQRGAFPVLDAALLLRRTSATLDWDAIRRTAGHPWAAASLDLLMHCLDRWRLTGSGARTPAILPKSFAEAARVKALHRLATAYIMERRAPRRLLTSRNLRSVWAAMVRPRAAWRNLLAVPVAVAFPPGDARFSLARAIRRVASVLLWRNETTS